MVDIRAKVVKNSFLMDILPIHVPWRPIKTILALTNSCNLKCTMCWRAVNNTQNEHMSEDVFMKTISYSNNRSIAFMGNGEPLLHPNIFEFMQICKMKNIGVNITTNGMLLSEDRSRLLLRFKNLESLYLSIDGVGENYNRIRLGGDFQTVIDNVIAFSNLRKRVKPYLLVNFVGMKSNIDDLPNLIKIVGKYVDTIQVLHLNLFSQGKTEEHLITNSDYTDRIFKESIEVARNFNVRLLLRSLKPHSSRCLIPWVSPYVGIRGEVYPCCSIGMNDSQEKATEYYNDMPITHKVASYSVGNVMDSNFNKIWNGLKLVEFRKELKNVHSLYTKNEYNEVTYMGMIKEWATEMFYCKVCPIRWNCSC